MKKFMIKSGCRNSQLSLIQTKNTLDQIKSEFPHLEFDIIGLESLGDKDKTIPLDAPETPLDIWTKELDQLLLDNKIDIAIHSAKDLSDEMPLNIDFFWLPWSEKPGDVLIYPKGKKSSDIPNNPVVATSSDRRTEYIKKYFPQATLKPIRGTIEERIEQLDRNEFDILIMAEAALIRLNITDRISHYIPLTELAPPEGQGKIAITYKRGNTYGEFLKSIYTYPINFVGAGPGDKDLITVKGLDCIKNANCILYDALANTDLLEDAPPNCECIFVGKRAGDHSMPQDKITRLMVQKVKQGKKVVRLKGGDPSVFGRLKEEINELQKEMIPFQIVPGISSLTGATLSGELLLTARGVNQCFITATATTESLKKDYLNTYANAKLPTVFFMGQKRIEQIAAAYLDCGWQPDTPIALIHASVKTETLRSTLKDISLDIKKHDFPSPALICIGEFASDQNKITSCTQPLQNKNILLPGVKESVTNLSTFIHNYGGNPISWPLVKLTPIAFTDEVIEQIKKAELIILTSPSSVRIFFKQLKVNKIRLKPNVEFAVTGPGTSDTLNQHGHITAYIPEKDYSSIGLNEVLQKAKLNNKHILFLHSQIGGKAIIEKFKNNPLFHHHPLYLNEIKTTNKNLPDFDTILFTSPSGIDNFLSVYKKEDLTNKTIGLIGKVTEQTAIKHNINPSFVCQNSTTEGLVKALIFFYFATRHN